MVKYKLIALDLDGTLVTTDKVLTEENIEVLQSLAKKGVKIVLASGRPTPGIKHVADELNLKELGGYILSYNGGRLVDCTTDQILFNKPLDKDLAYELYDSAKSFGLATMCYDEQNIITDTKDHYYIQYESNLTKMNVIETDSFKDSIPEGNVKILCAEKPEIIDSVLEEFKKPFIGRAEIYTSCPFYIECMPKGIEKSETLAKLGKIIGIKQEEMVAFGDNYNDISMIEYAGLGVAMKNGVDAIKEKANEVTEFTNDEDGVGRHLKKLIAENKF